MINDNTIVQMLEKQQISFTPILWHDSGWHLKAKEQTKII